MSKIKAIIIELSELAEVIAGQSPESSFYTKNKGTPFLQGNRTFGAKYPSIDTYTTKVTKLANKGDVLMSVRAPVGDVNIANSDICIGRGLASIRAKNKDNDFIYYALKYNMPNLLRYGNGTTFASVNRDDMEAFKVIVPANPEDRKNVSHLLSSIDEKIELNNKINSELENMAKTLYDYWFVQFDFPDEKGRPYKSANGKMVYNEVLKREIPEGWEVGTLRDICKIIRGVSYDKKVISDMYLKGFTPIFRANNIDNGHINYDSLVYVPNDLINSSQIIRKNDVIMTMSSGSLNHLGKTYKSKTNMNCSYGAFCSKITPTDNYRHYLSSFLSSRSFQIYIKNMCLGTNINNLNNDHIYSAPICIPNTSLLDSFNSIADTIFSEIGKNEQENIELVQVRDFLLPLLMNGQVSVQN